MSYTVVHWDGEDPPSKESVERRFASEGLRPSSWSNGPGDKYGEHSHTYNKVLYCVTGSITFKVAGQDVELHPGDRLDLSPGTVHSAVVGPQGVMCLEASR
jgi:quercetin dioxygenase-like cupin family protein